MQPDISNKVLICWGHTSAKQKVDVTFPVSYTSNTYAIVGGMESSSASTQTQGPPGGNRTSISKAFIFTGSASHYGFWMTIGY